jgi:hypothetical protein
MTATTDKAAADLLRHAADTITEFASGTTPGSWNGHLSSEGLGYGEVSGGPWANGYRMGTVMRWCEEAVTEYGGEPTLADLRWLCLMSPHIADPLIAWLRGTADALDHYPAMGAGPDSTFGRIIRDPGQPPAYRFATESVTAAIAFARALLDEDHRAALVTVVTTDQEDAMPERAR